MNLLKKLLWLWRVSQGTAEVKQLAEEHAGDREYRIASAKDALSIFEEYSSYARKIGSTTPEEGEIIEMMFIRRWQALENDPIGDEYCWMHDPGGWRCKECR